MQQPSLAPPAPACNPPWPPPPPYRHCGIDDALPGPTPNQLLGILLGRQDSRRNWPTLHLPQPRPST